MGEVSKKLAAILDVGDCTETMLALLYIFKQSPISKLDKIIPRIINKIKEENAKKN
ncbi:hypothetical protein [Gilliamella sp. wkB108]|uniref:hypothetical protein n=1 Tax=Gilliamella sp. wkB108 TaxID=3120256 RepID=UPI00159ED33D|nr:hypothetical protein [Gilliamella apicola]